MTEMFPGFEKMKMLDVGSSADYLGISRQAIYTAISKKRINPNKVDGKYFISERMLDEYKKHKYDRNFSLNLTDQEYTPKQLSKKLGIGRSALYYMIKGGVIKSHRRGAAYIISQKDVDDFLAIYPYAKNLKNETHLQQQEIK